MAKPKHIPIGWRVQLATGIVLAVMALMAVRVDVVNNYSYGSTVNMELAVILVLAALSVVCLPSVAAILGWSRHLRWTTTICVLLTVWSAINAYLAKQGAAILAAETSRKAYETAVPIEDACGQRSVSVEQFGT